MPLDNGVDGRGRLGAVGGDAPRGGAVVGVERVEDERAGELAAAVGAGAVLAQPAGPVFVDPQLGGISPTTFYALVKEGELSLVKIGRRSFVHTEDLDDFLRRKRYDASAQT